MSGGITWAGADLFGELAVQLALASNAEDGQVFCSVCGKPYEAKRHVARGGVHYCPAARCQKVAAARRASRYRSRRRAGGASADLRKMRYRGPLGGRTDDPLFSR